MSRTEGSVVDRPATRRPARTGPDERRGAPRPERRLPVGGRTAAAPRAPPSLDRTSRGSGAGSRLEGLACPFCRQGDARAQGPARRGDRAVPHRAADRPVGLLGRLGAGRWLGLVVVRAAVHLHGPRRRARLRRLAAPDHDDPPAPPCLAGGGARAARRRSSSRGSATSPAGRAGGSAPGRSRCSRRSS